MTSNSLPKKIENPNTRNGDIQSGHGYGIQLRKCALLSMRNGKQRITKEIEKPNQEKNQNARRRGKLRILGNNGSGHNQSNGDEGKKFKKVYLESTKKLFKTKEHKSHQRDKYLGRPSR